MPRMRILRSKEPAAFVGPKKWQRMAVYDSESARHPDYLCQRKAIGNWNFHRTHSGSPVKSVPRFVFGDQVSRYRPWLMAWGREDAELAADPSDRFGPLGWCGPVGRFQIG